MAGKGLSNWQTYCFCDSLISNSRCAHFAAALLVDGGGDSCNKLVESLLCNRLNIWGKSFLLEGLSNLEVLLTLFLRSSSISSSKDSNGLVGFLSFRSEMKVRCYQYSLNSKSVTMDSVKFLPSVSFRKMSL